MNSLLNDYKESVPMSQFLFSFLPWKTTILVLSFRISARYFNLYNLGFAYNFLLGKLIRCLICNFAQKFRLIYTQITSGNFMLNVENDKFRSKATVRFESEYLFISPEPQIQNIPHLTSVTSIQDGRYKCKIPRLQH